MFNVFIIPPKTPLEWNHRFSSSHEITRVNRWFQLYRVGFSAFSLAKWRWIRIFLVNHFCCKRMFPHRKMLFLHGFWCFLGGKMRRFVPFWGFLSREPCLLLYRISLIISFLDEKFFYFWFSPFSCSVVQFVFEGMLLSYYVCNYLYIN